MSQSSDTILNQLLDRLSNALNGIFNIKPMTNGDYMSHYNAVATYFASPEYNDALLTAPAPKPKPTKESEKMETNQDEIIIPGGKLYFSVKKFFRNYLENIAANGNNLEGEDFLRFYAKTWETYQLSSQIASGILGVINRNWIDRRQKDGVKGISDIYTMAMEIWQDIFFKESNQSLIQTCLHLINEERNGRRLGSLLIRQVVQSYVSAGFIKSQKNNADNRTISESLATYVEYFEKPFLRDTKQFYKIESNNFFENNSVNDYIKKVYQRFTEEEARVNNVLHPTTLEKLQALLVEILIQNQLEPMYIEAQKLLRDEKVEDLRKLFELINRVDRANEPIQKDLESYAYNVGIHEIDRKKQKAINDPTVYVETIIEVYEKFSKIVSQGFCNQQGYTVALDKAFSKIVNDNAVTHEAKKTTKSAELLARYCDTILRKGNKAEGTDVEEKINQIMVVFNYVEDKDAFQKVYGKLLAKRLVGQLSASDDYEESMISKLKAACGFEYSSKLQRMFQDIRLSATLINEYRTYCENKRVTDIVDFSVMVLTSNSWPFTPPPPFNLPVELKRTFESFTNFYSNKFSGRKLDWLHQHSKADLQTLYTIQKYTLQVSTYQMTILLLFNKVDSITVEDISDQTQFDNELTRQTVFSLLKSKVLICPQITADQLDKDLEDSDIKQDYTIQFDENFKSKKFKIILNHPIKTVEQKDREKDDLSLEEERKILIQAAIVRVMKDRKSLKHAILTQQVISLLNARFKPQISMIKRCIDILIEKEYLERDSKERDVFHYVA